MNLSSVAPFPQVWIPPWQANNIQLSATNTTEADELLCLIAQAMPKMVQSQKLQKLLTWAAQVAADSDVHCHPTAKRATAISLVLERAIALAHAHARGSNRTAALELSNTLTHALSHARRIVAQLTNGFYREIDSDVQRDELSRDFTHHVAQTWFDGQFDSKLVELSQAEAKVLNRYLHMSEWMIYCIEARIGISRPVWEAVVTCLIQPLDPVSDS